MGRKVLQVLIVLILIMLLTGTNFIFTGYNIVLAVSENLVQTNKTTNVQNVDFDAYFKQECSFVNEKNVNICGERTLILYINVKDKGMLSNAKILIDNANFEIAREDIENQYIKQINMQEGKIELNSITSGNEIELEIPIKFKKQEVFTNEYFTKENSITFSGMYKDEIETPVLAEKKLKINWESEVDVTINQNIEKYVDLGNNGTLLQQNISTEVIDNKLPREQETLNIKVPLLEEKQPEEIYVLLNGEKLEQDKLNYDKENNLLKIIYMNIPNEENEIIWGNAQNSYQVVYIYPNVIGKEKEIVSLDVTADVKLFTKDVMQKNEVKEQEITKTQNLVDIKKNIFTNEMYKGYLYNKTENAINFEEEDKINISNIQYVDNIEVKTLDNQFTTSESKEFIANDSIFYTGLSINKLDMIKILGENGNIIVKDESGMILATINNETEADENGNVIISYNKECKNININISKPAVEGSLTLKHLKILKGINNNYSISQLKSFIGLVSRSSVSTAYSEEIGEDTISLLDTKTEAKIEVSNNNLSTLQKNENVQFLITLISNNEKYDLYKNPHIEIVLPKELSVNVKNIFQMNGKEELTIVRPIMYTNKNGETIIEMELSGEQKKYTNDVNEGIQISIIADISIENTVPSMSSQITMNYTNENRQTESFSYQTPLNINSKYGVLMINKVSEYNLEGDVLENTDNTVKEGFLDINTQSKNANQEVTILNNYENEITNITLIGKMPENSEETINNQQLKATFGMQLLQNVEATGNSAKIYYSEDINAVKGSDSWKEQVDDLSKIKAFKIELENNKIEAGGMLKILSKVKIPENLGYNQSTYMNLTLSYNYFESDIQTNSTIMLKTANGKEEYEETEEEIVEQKPLTVEIKAKSGGRYLVDGESVKEGQGIKYELKVTNDTNEDVENIKITASHTNAIFYDIITYNDGWDSVTYEENKEYTRVEENEELKEKVFEIEKINAGETIELEYQFSVKEVVGELEKTSGQIIVKADNKDDLNLKTIENPIEQADIKIQMRSKYNEEYPIATTNDLPFFLDITNISGKIQNDITINVPVPEGFTFDTELLYETEQYEFIEYKDNVIVLKVPVLNVGETINIRLGFHIDSFDLNLDKKDFDFYYKAYINETEYVSNEMARTIYQGEAHLTATQTGSIEKEEVEDGDNLIYTITIDNNSALRKDISITDMVPLGAVINSVKAELYDISSGREISEEKIEANQYNLVSYEARLEQKQRLVLTINTTIDVDQIFENYITNIVNITVPGQELICNEVTYSVKGVDIDDEEETKENYMIQGIVWLDENKNGMREDTEDLLDNICVVLLNEETGKIATNNLGEECITSTGDNGEYIFDNLLNGKYTVLFKYNSTKYFVTEYQKSGVSENRNSDAISKNITLNGKMQEVAVTRSLNLNNNDLTNIDLGLAESEKFDLRLDKYVSKIVVQNGQGTRTINFTKEKFVKVEIDAKYVSDSKVTVEYQIDVTNEGEVPGYVNEIVDYIPKDLELNAQMNKNWYQSADGNLYSKVLANEIINPGETKTVTLTVSKNINSNNIGNIINSAEINSASNNMSLSDIDSVPGNHSNGEDDKSTAEVLVSIRTGRVVGYTILIIAIIVILGVGIYFIKKDVLNTGNKQK